MPEKNTRKTLGVVSELRDVSPHQEETNSALGSHGPDLDGEAEALEAADGSTGLLTFVAVVEVVWPMSWYRVPSLSMW